MIWPVKTLTKLKLSKVNADKVFIYLFPFL